MRKISKKQLIVGGIAVAVVAAGAGTAFAYWSTTGGGTGSASTGDVSGVTVNQTSTVADLYPGGPAAALAGDFTNSNSGSVFVNQVTVAIKDGWSAQADSSKPACTAADFTLVQPGATQAEIASGTHVGSWTGGSIALQDSATNQDNCKNVAVDLVYTSN